MTVHLDVRNESAHKRLFTRPNLLRLAERICAGEGVRESVELSLLLCDDLFIQGLNKQFRGVDAPTDVLSFGQEPVLGAANRALGDVVISLDTVHRRAHGDRDKMRAEVRLLFCHGVLHLLGYDHGTASARRAMADKQATYLDVPPEAAWIAEPDPIVAAKV